MRDALRTRVSDSGTASDGNDDAFARLPGVGDLVLFAIFLQRRVDLVGQPQQRKFAQRRQVSAPEVVGERRVDAFGSVDVAVGKPAPQRLRCDVDQLDLVGGAHHFVGHLLLLFDAGDLGDDVVQAFQMLDVDRGDDGDSGVEQLLDILPSLRVLAAGSVGVGEFVDQHDLRVTGQHRSHVELGEALAAILDVARRDGLDAGEQVCGLLAAVRLDDRRHHIGAALPPTMRLPEHRVGLTDAGRRPQVDAQLTALLLVVAPIRQRLIGRTHMIIIHR